MAPRLEWGSEIAHTAFGKAQWLQQQMRKDVMIDPVPVVKMTNTVLALVKGGQR
jgi:hypothetical protein